MPSANSQPQSLEPRELSTWQSIAHYLGVSVRTAKNYEQKYGMPVHRLPGERARVWAYQEEIKEWRNRFEQPQEIAPAQVEPELKLQRFDVIEPPVFRPKLVYWILAAAILGGLAVGLYWIAIPRGPIASFQVRRDTLIVTNSEGRELWQHRFPVLLEEPGYQRLQRHTLSWIGDWGSGSRLLFSTQPIDVSRRGNDLLCFSETGKVLWTYRASHGVRDASGNLVPPYYAGVIQVVHRRNPPETRIVVSSNHYMEHADQVAVLNTSGKILAEYWHPGHLLYPAAVDLDGDGNDELIIGGVNNGNHQGTLVVLDPWTLHGTTTPAKMLDDRFRLLDMAPAHEKAVVFFPRSAIAGNEPYTRVRDVRVLKDRIVVIVAEGMVETDPHIIYDLGYDLRVLNVSADHWASRAYQALFDAGTLDHNLNAAELERLKNGVVVVR